MRLRWQASRSIAVVRAPDGIADKVLAALNGNKPDTHAQMSLL